jgi:hypothetical protein
MGGNITKEMALKISKKLGCAVDTSKKAHDLHTVYHDGKVVASFGVRRSSKDVGHDHIPTNLDINPSFLKKMAQCFKERDDYLREKNLLPPKDDVKALPPKDQDNAPSEA